MVDVSSKPVSFREATASGRIRLRPETVKRIREGKVEKGDALEVARVACALAVKRTHEILPLCHPLRITGVDVGFSLGEDYVEAKVTVKAFERTGVEMEALVGVAAALLTIWDMVKKYEKDERGQYPHTEITGVRVLEKLKGS